MGNISKGVAGEQDLHRWDGTDSKTFTRRTSTGGTITLNDFGDSVDCLISYGAGVNYTLAAIQSALTAIGTTNKVGLILRPGTWTITNDVTITSNITLLPAPGCKFTVSAGKTATIQGPVEAGAYQWIYGTGTTTISTYPQDQAWWGNAERLDVTGLKVGSAIVSSFAQTLLDDASAAAARATLGLTELFMFNVGLAAAVSAKALTVSLKGADGNAPSATNPVLIGFRNSTLTTGTVLARSVTAATSVTLSSGSTLGFGAAEAGRLYVWALDNAGTIVLGLSRTADIFPESNLVSSTAEGGAGAADSACVMYSTAAQTNVACRCLGYIEITTGATAGEWDNAPTKIQVMGPGVHRTGDIVQIKSTYSSAGASGSTAMPFDDTIPQKTEGDEYFTLAFTPADALGTLHFEVEIHCAVSTAGQPAMAMFKDADANALFSMIDWASTNNAWADMRMQYFLSAIDVSARTYKLRCGTNSGTFYLNGVAARYHGGTLYSGFKITEVFA